MKKEKSYLVINIFSAWSFAKITAFWFPPKMFPRARFAHWTKYREPIFQFSTFILVSSFLLHPSPTFSHAKVLSLTRSMGGSEIKGLWKGLMAFIAKGSYCHVISPFFFCLPESILVQWSRSQGCELTLEGRAVSQGAAFDSRLCRYCILTPPYPTRLAATTPVPRISQSFFLFAP